MMTDAAEVLWVNACVVRVKVGENGDEGEKVVSVKEEEELE